VPDLASLSAVAQSAFPATFAFLYQQLDRLLARHRDRTGTGEELTAAQVPAALVGSLSLPLVADPGRLEARLAELEAYHFALARYQQDPVLVTASDTTLVAMAGRLRDALEEVHGQRFTFAGEERPRSGPFVVVRHKEVGGELIGMQASQAIRGDASVDIGVDVVHPGGRVVGMTAPVIEGST
jgi:hypothetical protein